jgi:capsular polysaccharide biosynthesis protein
LLIAALAAAGLLGASAVSGLLLEFLDPVIVGTRQLEADTGMAPLGVVPRIR